MYELEYVKKRKRKKLVAIVGFISATVVTAFAIVAFLGRFVGTFTVSLETRNVELTLLEKKDSTQRNSFLRVGALAALHEYTYSYFDYFYGDDQIDNDETSPDLGANRDEEGEIISLNFFKYTCFIENVGDVPAKYDWALNIVEDVLSENGESLMDSLRVMIYVDGEKTVYGKALSTPHLDENGEPDYRAPISVDEYSANEDFPFMGYAEKFESSKVVTTFQGITLDVGEKKRYTIVTWLEGFRSSNDQFAPRGAKMKLGVEINAYENK